jgi:hypothetical protein
MLNTNMINSSSAVVNFSDSAIRDDKAHTTEGVFMEQCRASSSTTHAYNLALCLQRRTLGQA